MRIMLMDKTPSGQDAVWKSADGTIHEFFQFNDRGRGSKIYTSYRLDSRGLIVFEEFNGVDDGSYLVLKLSPSGRVLLVLGKKNLAAESDWLFNQPTDVAFGKNGEIYVSDGYGNSRIVEFDRSGNFIRAWGSMELNLGSSICRIAWR